MPELKRREFLAGAVASAGLVQVGCQTALKREQEDSKGPLFGLNLLLYTAAVTPDKVSLIERTAELGYDAVEVPLNDLSLVDVRAVSRAREKAGLVLSTCCVMMPGENLASSDPEERRRGRERVKRMIQMTAEMGGRIAAGPIYAPVRYLTGKWRTQAEWEWLKEGLREGAEWAEKNGILLAIEPLNRFETYLLNTAGDVRRLITEVGHPALRVQIDTFHANIEEKDTAQAAENCGHLLGHVHASESDRGIPGTAQVRWREFFRALKKIDYHGLIVLESFATDILDLCAAACIWRKFFDSPDECAQKGLRFLREAYRAA